jgi:hypothetical protein
VSTTPDVLVKVSLVERVSIIPDVLMKENPVERVTTIPDVLRFLNVDLEEKKECLRHLTFS